MSTTPKGWVVSTVGDLFTTVGGGTPKTSVPEYWGEDVPWTTSADIGEHLQITPRKKVSQLGIDGSATKVVPPGSVIVATRVALGKVGITPVSLCFSQDCQALVVDERILDSRFVAHQMMLRASAYRGRGTTISGITKKQLLRTTFSFPPLPQQRRIVDELEENLNRLSIAITSLEHVKSRLPIYVHSSAQQSFSSTPWPTVPLADISEVVGGVTKDKKRESGPSLTEVPYLRVANVQRGHLDLGEIRTIRVSKDKLDKLTLQRGDILFTEGGDRDKLGRGWIWENQIKCCIHQNHIFRARLKSADFDPKFVSLYANHCGQYWFRQMGKQTTNLASIGLRSLRRFPVPCVPVGLQRRLTTDMERINSNVAATDRAIDSALSRAMTLRRALLRDAFSGQRE